MLKPPSFSSIQFSEISAVLDKLLSENRLEIQTLLENKTPPTWESLMGPLETLQDRIANFWAPIRHLHSVKDSAELRSAYEICLQKLTEYHNELGQNQQFYQAVNHLKHSEHYQHLTQAQKKIIENTLRDLHLTGVDLSEDKKAQFKSLQIALTQLETKFEQNVLDATEAWHLHITDESELSGIALRDKTLFAESAKKHKQTGWRIGLDTPAYLAVIQYADNRALRQKIYEAYTTRASDQGPNAGQFDNSPLLNEILEKRQQSAELLGYPNYAALSLTTKMAETPDEVLHFLRDLATRAKPAAKKEFQSLCDYAKEQGLDKMQAWDMAFYSEKLSHARYDISEETLRPYFPIEQVLKGLFEIVHRLYGITVASKTDVDTWHPDVQFFEIKDRNGELRGGFYLDLYARSQKRGGAWMDECVMRRKLAADTVQTPLAFLTCNFTPPVTGQTAQLSHEEVLTLFHEFGHGIHHMLTKVDYAGVSGINGVPWDAVELPSQFMENWCWEKDALPLISKHVTTGEPLPAVMIEKLQASKNFQSAMHLARQCEFSLFDFYCHLTPKPGQSVQDILDRARAEVAVVEYPRFNRFQDAFTHVFSGGYAAGYYSYKWAEVLAHDAFGRFKEEGIFNAKTGKDFLENILERGGTEDPIALFTRFRGRKPTIDALLTASGIEALPY